MLPKALKKRLAQFPPELGQAMIEHFLRQGAPWRAVSQLLHRDGDLWCRELHGLEDEVLGLLAAHASATDLSAVRRRRGDFAPD